jgi:hypothetical protein
MTRNRNEIFLARNVAVFSLLSQKLSLFDTNTVGLKVAFTSNKKNSHGSNIHGFVPSSSLQ